MKIKRITTPMTMKNKDYHTNIKQIAHQSWCYKERGEKR